MFTGIIEEIGAIQNIRRGTASSLLTISGQTVLKDVKDGDSIAVNGVCLTVTSHMSTNFTADVMHETLNRSSLGNLRIGSKVNLERAMAANGRFGGHIVSGHIDGLGTIVDKRQDDIAVWYQIETSPSILRYIIEKGSIAIDGISLTVARVSHDSFQVSIIPHTAAQTTLSFRKIGDRVNLENDLIGKYVEKLITGCPAPSIPNDTIGSGNKETPNESTITKDFILKYDF
ncbi:MAG: riboflavin synthase [Firmicutes bacterium]|nr:riboflavin synthase [Bacillota bacterium]